MFKHKAAYAASSVILAAGSVFGVTTLAYAAPAASPSAGSSTSPSATATPTHGTTHAAPKHQPQGEAAKLAKLLGTDEAKTKTALTQARADVAAAKKTNPKLTAQQAHDTEAASLAKSLGVDQAKVSSALTELRTEAKADRRATLKQRLDKTVTAGKLTQADEDSILKAFDAGVLPQGAHKRHK